MANQLYLLIGEKDNKEYLYERAKEIANTFATSYTNKVVLTSWVFGIGNSNYLFQTPFILLDLTDDKNYQAFKKLDKTKFTDNWFQNDVIILSCQSKDKSLVKFVKSYGGVVETKPKVEDAVSNLLKDLPLSETVLCFIRDYVGDSYDDLVSVKNTLKTLSKEQISSLTEDSILTYLPTEMGKKTFFPLLSYTIGYNGRRDKLNLIDKEYQRLVQTYHPFLLLTLLKNKVACLSKYQNLKRVGLNDQEVVKAFGYKSAYALKDYRDARNADTTMLMKLICFTENHLKTSTRLDNVLELRQLFLNVGFLIQRSSR